MTQDTAIKVGEDWTLLTDSDVTEITFVNIGAPIFVKVTNGTTVPTNDYGIPYQTCHGEGRTSLVDLAPGVTGGNRVWAKVQSEAYSYVWVSHA